LSDTAARSYTGIAIAIVIAGVLISASLFVAVDGATKTVTTTETSTSTSTATTTASTTVIVTTTSTSYPGITTTTVTARNETTSSDSIDGLRLVLSVNSDPVTVGNALVADVLEFNSQATANNVTASRDWAISAVLSSCPNTNVQPFGIALYSGYYTAQNVSKGTQLQIFPATVCPEYERYVSGYLFQADSDVAVVLPGSGAAPMTGSAEIVNGTAFGQGAVQPLGPGLYTLVAADEWGTLAFLYVQVNG
jgi:hypothetical protein